MVREDGGCAIETEQYLYMLRKKKVSNGEVPYDFLSYKTPGGFAPEAGARFGS
jgi:hypothetical protein